MKDEKQRRARSERAAISHPTPFDRSLARICELCPVCRHARKTQAGLAFNLVRSVETGVCPFCRAYERVHGRKAHEPAD